ncbi:MAG: 4Fe-4S dicluster domain-containing protein [Planctomycetia bacterium]|nr:4Fe-4S dicluster domain-containing protein [Planctomycetia bacterium]
MAHHINHSAYNKLVGRLNRFPQGAPPSELLTKILKILFSSQEAELVSLIPIKPFTAQKASKIWKMDLVSTKNILDKLAQRALLVDIKRNGKTTYALPPPMAGFFEFSMMRVRNDIDQKVLSELFYQYITKEDDFIRSLFTEGNTQLGRTFIHEPVLTEDNALHVLDYERATQVIETASHMGISMCYCRHKKEHLNMACDAPMNICMTFNTTAASLIRHGHARKVDKVEGLDLLQEAYDNNLVQFGENVQKRVNFICNCCGCCCEAMIAAQRFAIMNPVHTTNFLPLVEDSKCNGCGKCVNVCPVEAMTLISANNPNKIKMKKARLNEEICLGCGLCVKACDKDTITLKPREKRVITPTTGVQRAVIMAIERGKLQNLIFDNRVLWSHRALSAVLGAILKLSPIKRTLAKQQLKSAYVETVIH